MELATAFVRVRADTAGLARDLSGTQTQIAAAGKKAAAQVTDSFEASRRGALAAGQEVTRQLAQWFGAAMFVQKVRGAVNAASDLNETLSKTKNIFGDLTPIVEQTAETAARSMGMSKRAYLDAASGLKGLLDNMGLAQDESTQWSMDLTKLGGDLASFFNTDPADAIYAISAALRGETEPIRRYNVQINDMALRAKALEMNLYDGKGALDANTKAQAALALIMEQTSAAADDFTETADGVANSQRINAALAEDSAASFGQVLLPVYQRVVQVVGFLTEQFGRLPGPVQVAVVALIGIVALAGPLNQVVSAAKAVTAAIGQMGTTAKTSLGVFSALLVIGSTLWTLFSDGEESTTDVTDATRDLAVQLKASTTELLANAAALRALRGELPASAVGMSTLSNAALDALESLEPGAAAEVTAALGEMGLTAKDAARVLGVLTQQVNDGQLSNQDLAEAIFGLKDGSVTASEAIDMLGGSVGQVDTPMGRLASLVKRINQTTEDGAPIISQMAGAFIEQAAGASELTAGLVEQARAQAAANGQGDDAIAVYLAYLEVASDLGGEQLSLALDLGAAAAAAAAAADETDEQAASSDRAKRATADLRDRLGETRLASDDLADAADALRQALDRVLGGTLSAEEANRAYAQAVADLSAQFEEVDDQGNRLSNTLDINTQRGRENREAIQGTVQAIIDQGTAMVGAGASTADATAYMEAHIEALRQQLAQYGLNEDEIDSYLETLGATPESIMTAVRLADVEKRKADLDALLEQLGDIDEGAAAEIQALIDQGAYDEAEAKIQAIAVERDIPLRLKPVGGSLTVGVAGGGAGFAVKWLADGGVFDSPTASVVGEAGAEAVLPLSRPSRLRTLLADPRVRGPIEAALSPSGGGAAVAAPAGETHHHWSVTVYGTERRYVEALYRKMRAMERGG